MAAEALSGVGLPPRFLAPMAEFTAPPMRVLCEDFGAARTYTEMVNAEGLCRGSEKTLFLLETFPEERHVWAHLYGADPARLAEAARRAEALGRFEGIDLNAGCPVPRITAQGAGAALLKDLPRLGKILEAMVKAVSLPVTLKTRLGPHPQAPTWRETLRVAREAGVAAVTFHARYTSQGHAGGTHLGTLAEIVAEAGNCPFAATVRGSTAQARRRWRPRGCTPCSLPGRLWRTPGSLPSPSPTPARWRSAIWRWNCAIGARRSGSRA